MEKIIGCGGRESQQQFIPALRQQFVAETNNYWGNIRTTHMRYSLLIDPGVAVWILFFTPAFRRCFDAQGGPTHQALTSSEARSSWQLG